jgi:hypothetical protein
VGQYFVFNKTEAEYRVFRRIFEPETEELIEEWSKLHKQELYNLYTSPDIKMFKPRRLRWREDSCSTNGVEENANGILMGKPERIRSFGRPRRRWKDAIRDGYNSLYISVSHGALLSKS